MTMWFTKLFRQLSGFIGSFSQPVPNPTPEDAELGGITFEQAMSNPLKYSGYPEFSKFLAAEPNFPMVRRFDKLGVRAILRLQDEIRTIEQAIDHIDDEMMKPNGQANNNGTFRHDRSAERQRLIWRASAKLDRYYRFVHLYAQLRDWPSPTDRDLKSVRGWVDTRTHWEWQSGPLRTVKPQIRPIEQEEIEFLEAPDLLAIVPEKRSALRRLLERNDRSWLARLFRKEIPRSLKSNAKNNPLVVADDKALERFDRLVTGFIGLAMLIAPLWIIGSVRPYYPKVGVITCFIFVCLVLVRTGTNAKPSEALGVTAGHAAVLMVLLQVKKGDY